MAATHNDLHALRPRALRADGACTGAGASLSSGLPCIRASPPAGPHPSREFGQLHVNLVDLKTASEFVAPLNQFFDGFGSIYKRPQPPPFAPARSQCVVGRSYV